MIYIVINTVTYFLNCNNLGFEKSLFSWELLTPSIFFGIGFTFYACKVYFPNFIIGKNWKNRK